MTSDPPYDPDETQPYSREPQDGQESPTYEQPAPAAEPPSPSGQAPPSGAPTGPPPPPPWGQATTPPPTYQQAPYGQPAPGYGYAPMAGYAQAHSRATTSMVLGIVALVGLVTGPMLCCVTLPAVLAAPFAIWTGLSAKREIDLNPAAYNNRGQAVAGYVMGIVACALAAMAVLAFVVLFAGTGFTFGP